MSSLPTLALKSRNKNLHIVSREFIEYTF
jgi:hypothetical protein